MDYKILEFMSRIRIENEGFKDKLEKLLEMVSAIKHAPIDIKEENYECPWLEMEFFNDEEKENPENQLLKQKDFIVQKII